MKAVEIDELGSVNVTEEALIPIVDPLNGVGRVHLKEVRGLGVKSQETFFLVSNTNTGVTIATSGWVTTPRPTTATSRYLWSYTKFTYNDNRVVNTAPAVIGVYGDKGDKGDKGDTGIQGIQGVKGDKGDKGDQGVQGIQGEKGDTGKPFTIAKTYTSIAEMNNSFATDGIEEGSFVIIDTGDADDVDTGKLYIKDSTEYRYVTDMSSAGGVGNAVSFTYVVDSDEALKAWANNVAGNDYTSVLIRKGTWTSDVGVNLTTAGTKVVHGEAGSKLVFNQVENGLFYDESPTGSDYWMRDVSIEVSSTYEVDGGGYCEGFSFCTNLTNCSSNSAGTDRDYGDGYGTGFFNCTNLTNCTGTGTGTGTGETCPGTGTGFENCTNITNCSGSGTGTGTVSGQGYGFKNCTNLTNCSGSGTGTLTGTSFDSGYGFSECKGVSHCKEGDTPCTTALFYQSYASLVEDERFLCNGTADGGFNGNDVSSFGVAGDLQSLTTTEKSSLVGAINEVKAKTNNKIFSMVSLGFTVDSTVQLEDFLQTLQAKEGLQGLAKIQWYNGGMARVTDGTTTVELNGGLFVWTTQGVFYSSTYSEVVAVYHAMYGASWKFIARVSSVAGTAAFRKIYSLNAPPINHVYTQYSGQIAPASLYGNTAWSNITSSVTAPTGATVWKRTK